MSKAQAVAPAENVRALTPNEENALTTRKPAWRNRANRRSMIIALISTIVVGASITAWLTSSPSWQTVTYTFFSGEHMAAALPQVWDGFLLNVRIFLVAEPVILAVGLLLAIARGLRQPVFFPLRAAAIGYIDFFRGIPAILLILMLGFGMPALKLPGVPADAVFWGTVACVLTSSAYTAETFRAGIDSVHDSQRSAARSLGLSSVQTMGWVILPQAIRRVIPPLLSGFVGLQKETALIAVIGPLEATRQAQIYAATTFNFSSYVVASLLFVAITIPLARLTDHLLAQARRRRNAGGTA